MRVSRTTVLLSAVLTLLFASSASAMGRSEDPRDARPALGTDADPAIRDSDRQLTGLLFQPGAKPSSQAAAASAAGKPSASPATPADH